MCGILAMDARIGARPVFIVMLGVTQDGRILLLTLGKVKGFIRYEGTLY